MDLSFSSEPIPTSREGGKSIRQQQEERTHLVRRKSSPTDIIDPWNGGARGEGEVFRFREAFGRCPHPIGVPRGSAAVIKLSPLHEVCEMYAQGPSRGKEEALPENGEPRRRNARDHVRITEETPTFRAVAHAWEAQIVLLQDVGSPSRVHTLAGIGRSFGSLN